jgi:hypothetical protein
MLDKEVTFTNLHQIYRYMKNEFVKVFNNLLQSTKNLNNNLNYLNQP